MAVVLLCACTSANHADAPVLPSEGVSGAPTQSQSIETQRGVFTARLRLTAAVSESRTVAVDVPDGMRFVPSAMPSRVARGKMVGRLQIEKAVLKDLQLAAPASTVAASRLEQLRRRETAVNAPVAGTLSLKRARPTFRSTGLDVLTPLSPLQLLRYRGFVWSGIAGVETVFGFRSVTCLAVWADVNPEGGASVRCRLPDGVETAPGVTATLSLTSEPIDCVAVPTRFVGYDAKSQNYFVLPEEVDGEPIPVVVGPTDGIRRTILSNLGAGLVLRVVDVPEAQP